MVLPNWLILLSYSLLGWVTLSGLQNAIAPLFISFFLVYLSFPLIQKLETLKIQRIIATFFVFATFFILGSIILRLTIPVLLEDFQSFLKSFPKTLTTSLSQLETMLLNLGFDISLEKEDLTEYILSGTQNLSTETIKSVSAVFKKAFSGVSGFVVYLLNIFLIPVFYIFVMNQYETITKEIKSYIPKPYRKSASDFSKQASTIFSAYFRGQLTVALILAVLYSIGLWMIGLEFAFLIGFFTGLLSIVPYVGFTLGFVAALLISFANFSGFGQIFSVISVFTVVQLLESFLITPKIVGDRLGLSSLTTMLVLIIGGNLGGFIGILLSIPVAAITKILLQGLKKSYFKSSLYLGKA